MIHIIAGGTLEPLFNHMAICGVAFGRIGHELYDVFKNLSEPVTLHLTKMADPKSDLVSYKDVDNLIDTLIEDISTKAILLPVAICDYYREGGSRDLTRPTANTICLTLEKTPKLIHKIKKRGRDIFVVGFKTCTSDEDPFYRGLKLLNENGLNLVVSDRSIIVTPERTKYAYSPEFLAKMMLSRMKGRYATTTIVQPWYYPSDIPNFGDVFRYLQDKEYFKRVGHLGTPGHFGVIYNGNHYTSCRKKNYNDPSTKLGLVKYTGDFTREAYFELPSVGDLTQKAIFNFYSELCYCIHFHTDFTPQYINKAEQWPYECGSDACALNTLRSLGKHDRGIYAVHLMNHGPNIAWGPKTSAQEVIQFIKTYYPPDKV